jgi:hypothetical protein
LFVVVSLCLGISSTAQAACYVYITQNWGEADHKVYFTENWGEQKNQQLIEGCKLTQNWGEATFKVYFTKNWGEATIVILREKFPKP